MATPTHDPTMETSGDVSDHPTMETGRDVSDNPTIESSDVGVLSDVPMVGRSLHVGAASANFKVTGLRGIVENAKVNINKLYLRQIFGGNNANQSYVIEPNAVTGLGKIGVNNWGVYDGFGSLVAIGHGMHTLVGKWSNWFTLVFVVERFKGSTLQVMGANDDNEENEWAIVGGTGEFAMARGIIKRRVHSFTGDTITLELTIEFFCRMKEVIVPPSTEIPAPWIPAPWSPAPPKIPARAKRGPWGGNGGTLKDMEGKSQRLESLTVYHEGTVEGFQFSYVDEEGQIRTTGIWGTNNNRRTTEIKFGPSEYVKQITGAGHYGNPSKLCQFKIVTNNATYGPMGDWNGTPFSFTVPENEIVVGFFGSINHENYITTIGVYTIPNNSVFDPAAASNYRSPF